MAKKPKKSGGGKLLLVLVVVALILVAAYFLKDCGLGGLGLGKGPGAGGTGSAAASAAPSTSAASSASAQSALAAEPFIVRVTGTGCKIGKSEEAQTCAEACSSADQGTIGRTKREVKLFPADGSQEVVDTLKKCLKEKGLTILEADN
ncbi:MAG: hypothetical protein HOW73_36265 [Polyangiaceae bacterium]|nr:hypothetical protein [Polyangiaceae bacterium]